MILFITIEAQSDVSSALMQIAKETIQTIHFVTDKNSVLENINNYGTEFKVISIIPSCVDDEFWNALGWKERKQIWRKKGEADIRLRMDYDRFVAETPQNQRLLFYGIIVKSIQAVQERSEGDFRGDDLIKDILSAFNVSKEDLKQLNAI